jgi:hypothetical protein
MIWQRVTFDAALKKKYHQVRGFLLAFRLNAPTLALEVRELSQSPTRGRWCVREDEEFEVASLSAEENQEGCFGPQFSGTSVELGEFGRKEEAKMQRVTESDNTRLSTSYGSRKEAQLDTISVSQEIKFSTARIQNVRNESTNLSVSHEGIKILEYGHVKDAEIPLSVASINKEFSLADEWRMGWLPAVEHRWYETETDHVQKERVSIVKNAHKVEKLGTEVNESKIYLVQMKNNSMELSADIFKNSSPIFHNTVNEPLFQLPYHQPRKRVGSLDSVENIKDSRTSSIFPCLFSKRRSDEHRKCISGNVYFGPNPITQAEGFNINLNNSSFDTYCFHERNGPASQVEHEVVNKPSHAPWPPPVPTVLSQATSASSDVGTTAAIGHCIRSTETLISATSSPHGFRFRQPSEDQILDSQRLGSRVGSPEPRGQDNRYGSQEGSFRIGLRPQLSKGDQEATDLQAHDPPHLKEIPITQYLIKRLRRLSFFHKKKGEEFSVNSFVTLRSLNVTSGLAFHNYRI